MPDTEYITVAETSEGVGATGAAAESVDLPVVDVLTGRGFVTGKSGGGKSNTASVVAEKLLDNGFGLLIVDVDGEYYGLKEEYEILHAGADEECDIQVTVDHAERIAALALEENVPIILDISSFLDENEADELLTEVSRQLFAKAKKQKQPFLMLVEECHEWIPENGSVGEPGKMLIKIGKRGRKHGLGIVGISQRPADVKKDFITQCDWIVWHRLTWDNDTKVVGRILDSTYAGAVEDLDDGEAFLMSDWGETVRRVQFHRKTTFDAGATPGLDDFQRPELKSVSEDLVEELASIGDDEPDTDDRLQELRETLDEKNSRIAELEAELQDARDLSRMAEQFTDALLDHVEGVNPGRTVQERERRRRERWREGDDEYTNGTGTAGPDPDGTGTDTDGTGPGGDGSAGASAAGAGTGTGRTAGSGADDGATAGGDGGTPGDGAATADRAATTNGGGEAAANGDGGATAGEADREEDPETAGSGWPAATEIGPAADDERGEATSGGGFGDAFGAFADDAAVSDGTDGTGADGSSASDDPAGTGESAWAAGTGGATAREVPRRESTDAEPAVSVSGTDTAGMEPPGRREPTPEPVEGMGTTPRFLVDLEAEVRESDEVTRGMLARYVERGPTSPGDALAAAGGSGDRTTAYAHNRRLRLSGFVEHVGRGRYDSRLVALVREESDRELDEDEARRLAGRLRATIESTV